MLSTHMKPSDLEKLLRVECTNLAIPRAAMSVIEDGIDMAPAVHAIDSVARPHQDLFPVGCLAKMLTALVLLRMCARKALTLSTPVVELT